MRGRRLLVAVGAVALAGAVPALAYFEPWQLWVDTRVDEPIPTVAAPAGIDATSAVPTGGDAPTPTASSPQPSYTILASGDLISHEHETDGTVAILELADGSRILRLENLDTSSGPDLKVWLTDAPVIDGSDGWHVFDDGAYVDLGSLKANHGNHNYAIPASADLSELDSMSIWCDRFNVSFGAASLA
jgi:hypothetical protein